MYVLQLFSATDGVAGSINTSWFVHASSHHVYLESMQPPRSAMDTQFMCDAFVVFLLAFVFWLVFIAV